MLCKYVRYTTNFRDRYAAMKMCEVRQGLLVAEIAKCKSAYSLAKRPQQRGHYSLDKV